MSAESAVHQADVGGFNSEVHHPKR
jgi:hypothetical protein